MRVPAVSVGGFVLREFKRPANLFREVMHDVREISLGTIVDHLGVRGVIESMLFEYSCA